MGKMFVRTLLLLAVVACGGAGVAETTAATGESVEATVTTAAPAVSTTASSTTTTAPPVTTTTPAATTTTTMSLEELRSTVQDLLISVLEESIDVERVETISISDGELAMELRMTWSSEDRQLDSHWQTVTLVAQVFELLELESTGAQNLFGGTEPVVRIDSVSDDGDYPVISVTPYEVVRGIAARSVGKSDWETYVS